MQYASLHNHYPFDSSTGLKNSKALVGQSLRAAASLSHSGESGVLGEVKWKRRSAGRSTLDEVNHDLIRKGHPHIDGIERMRVLHAVFVPQVEPHVKIAKLPHVVIDAETVLSSLR